MKERLMGLLGHKIGMTTIFDEAGSALGVTVLQLGPCLVQAKRTLARDGYRALVLGFGARRADKVSRPLEGALRAVGGKDGARRHVMELRVTEAVLDQFNVGQEVSVGDLGLNVGDLLDVMGTSKGKGFAGVMKRHNFGGFRATHGTHEYFRHGGSIGCRKWPGRVYKGRKMPGHMGDRRVTTQNLEVVQVRPEDNAILVLGAVPGAKNGLVLVRPAIKVKTKAA
jgi:large subunit ribosomal protein L3